jgi:DNA ligase D-like protein (predicted 3'-phosphoesterase)
LNRPMSVAVLERKSGEEEGAPRRFVVQEHDATRLHWDFRLEMDGVLKSWAVPKEPPTRPGVRRLAVQVEDHDLDYIGFEGTIPEGEYGAGTVTIWDRGTYELENMKPDKLVFELRGEKMRGRYTLVHFTDKPENWLLFKTKA